MSKVKTQKHNCTAFACSENAFGCKSKCLSEFEVSVVLLKQDSQQIQIIVYFY